MMTLARRLLASRGRVVLRLLSASALPSYSRGRTQPPLLDLTIGCAFRQVVSRVPAAPAVTSAEQGLHLTYQQLSDAVQTAARALLAAGVKRGDRVGILSPNKFVSQSLPTAAFSLRCYQCRVAHRAAVHCCGWSHPREHQPCVSAAAAARFAPLLTLLLCCSYRLSELIHAVNISGLSLLFAAESFKTSDYRAMLQQGRESMPSLRRTVFIGSRDWEEAMGSGEAVAPDAVLQREEELSCTDPINIQFTSGTTALPKGATLSHRNILNNAFHVGSLLNYTSADRICIPVPL
jgi:fatty-acyl-CoA synthase